MNIHEYIDGNCKKWIFNIKSERKYKIRRSIENICENLEIALTLNHNYYLCFIIVHEN